MKHLKIISAVLLGLVLTMLGGSIGSVHAKSFPTSRQSTKTEIPPSSFVVCSEGSVDALPDTAEVFLQIEYSDLIKETSESEAWSVFQTTKEAIISQGIPEESIKTHNSFTYPCHGFKNDYRTNIHFSFETKDLNNLENLLTNMENDYVTIHNINYKVSDCEKYYHEALKTAVSSSLAKAQALSDSDSLTLIRVEECCNYCCDCFYREYNKKNIANEIATPIKITANIQATYVA